MTDRLPSDQAARTSGVDPTQSFVVQAPAGSGKTTLLVERYLALLSRVDRPEEILAITFTRKAAAEMRKRVLQALSSNTDQARSILDRDERLGWRITRNPNRLKIQTIDSFALELAGADHSVHGLSGVRLIEEADREYRQAGRALLRLLRSDDVIAPLVADLLAQLGNSATTFENLVASMLKRRDQWIEPVTALAGDLDVATAEIKASFERTLGRIYDERLASLDAALEHEDRERLDVLSSHWPGHDSHRWSGATQALLTADGSLRKRLTKNDGLAKPQVTDTNRWLRELHDRGLARRFEQVGRIPLEMTERAIEVLRLACINLALAATRLDRAFLQEGTLDFPGLLLAAKRSLSDRDGHPTMLAERLDYRIKHVLIDEFQDTSRSQIAFFKDLLRSWDSSDANTLFAVGDPMQSIYRFRDADVSIFTEVRDAGLEQIHPRPLYLDVNFRSDAVLIEWVNRVFDRIVEDQETAFRHSKPGPRSAASGSAPRVLRFDDRVLEVAYWAEEIEKRLNAHPDEPIALLCRNRAHVADLLESLRARGVPWSATEMDELGSRPIVIDLLSCLELIADPNNRLGLAAVLRSPMYGLTLDELLVVLDSKAETHWMERLSDARGTRLKTALSTAQSTLYEVPLEEVLRRFWVTSGGLDAYETGELTHAESLFESIAPIGLGAFSISEIRDAVARLRADTRSNAALNVLTIHKAKGLEWPHVIVPFLDRGTKRDDPELIMTRPTHAGLLMGARDDTVYEWLRDEQRELAREEETRLLYVACTRAQKSLGLSFTGDGNAKGLARWLAPFAEEAPLDAPADGKATAATSAQETLFSSATFSKRLPRDYVYQAPILPALPEPPNDAGGTSAVDTVSRPFEVKVGITVHDALAWIADSEVVPETWTPELEARLTGVWATDADDSMLIDEARRQLEVVLASDTGRWILSPHSGHEAESPFTSFIDGIVDRIIIDRMFVHEGERWIIDYKTTRGERDPDRVKAYYTPQLRRYAKVVENAFDEPVVLALFLTDRAELLRLDQV